MILISCIDEHFGLTFNNRRQSRDKSVISDIRRMCQKAPLWMNGYSAKLFTEAPGEIRIDEAFLTKAGKGEFCFLEDVSPSEVLDAIEEIVLYKWNRSYPADFYFDIDMSGWTLIECKEFAGNSHEKITRERYQRK